ncbi:MAG: hypothetical protein AAFQ50_17225, partial [Pseudomonadota bacterium]
MTWFHDRLRSEGGILVLPGAFDALSARLIARAGHEAVYCGGFASLSSTSDPDPAGHTALQWM